MHTDHCAKKLLPWFDGMLKADEEYFKEHGHALFRCDTPELQSKATAKRHYSSHMLDLSEEPKAENIEICKEYLKKMAPLNLWLEMEIGITGGEEDGVDNTGVDNASLYTQPEDIWEVYEGLSSVSRHRNPKERIPLTGLRHGIAGLPKLLHCRRLWKRPRCLQAW